MRTVSVFLSAVCGLAALVLLPAAASAQTTRTFVSGLGDDANVCSRAAPCKTFAGAISRTTDGGVINVLDAAGYGVVTITKGVTIRADGADAAISTFSTGSSILVNAPDKQVNLVGLDIDGMGTGSVGIRVIAARQVHIENCRIFNHSASGGTGLLIAAAAEARVTIRGATISGNQIGIDVAPPGASPNSVILDDVMLDANATANLRADKTLARATMRRSTILGSPVTLTNGAQLRSFGDNAFAGGNPTRTDPLR